MARVVLFTGGSASNPLARLLEAGGVAATHVVSVFDNGGSTGKLRRIADLPAMGDLRNRLCALASTSTPEAIRMRSLFELRLSEGAGEASLRHELDRLLAGDHLLTRDLDSSHRREALDALAAGRAALPADFPLAKTSIGNLLIFGRHQQAPRGRAGAFLEAIDWAAHLLGVRSRVLPVTLESVHLGAELDGGQWLAGQAALTDERTRPRRRISRLALLLDEDSAFRPAGRVDACPEVLEAVATADAVVFGFGSFYSSILPHLLVSGVTDAIARRRVPRIWLVNPTADRETDLMTVADIVRTVAARTSSAGEGHSPFLTHVVHFSGEGDLAIPAGDLSCFLGRGGEVLSEPDRSSFEAVAQRAAIRVLSLATSRSKTARRSPGPGYPVVLIDLDHTLYDYGGLRRGAAVAALSTFCRGPEATCDLLLEHLVPPTTHVLREYGFADLRREWNCPAFYAWAKILDDPRLGERALESLRGLRTAAGAVRTTSPFEARSGFHALARSVEAAAWREIADEALASCNGGDDPFAAQLAAFETHVAAHARLVPGAQRLLDVLAGEDVPVIVVTEGDSAVQGAKIEYLGLEELVISIVVADQTLGAAGLVEEIFQLSTRGDSTSPHLAPAYDELHGYLVKTPRFYAKLVHSLVAAGPQDLEAAIGEPAFLTEEEWAGRTKPRVAAVGDRYHKDLEPLLAACRHGVTALRVLQGRYSAEFPLHEILATNKPVPSGHFTSLAATQSALLAWTRASGPEVSRPRWKPNRPAVAALADSTTFLSPAAARSLAAIDAEFARHRR